MEKPYTLLDPGIESGTLVFAHDIFNGPANRALALCTETPEYFQRESLEWLKITI